MRIIDTGEDWLELFRSHWNDLYAIVNRFTPYEALFEKLKESDDVLRLCNLLEEAWWNAPDDPKIHDIPSWDVLCDLCSEVPEEVQHDG